MMDFFLRVQTSNMRQSLQATGIQAKGGGWGGGAGQRMALPQILYKLVEIMPRKVSKQIR